jgi:hypothetical protein
MKLTKFYPVDINDEKFQKHWRMLALAYYLKHKGAYLLEGEERNSTKTDNDGKTFDDFYIIKIDDKDKEALAAATIAEFEKTVALSKEDWKIVTEKEFKVEEKAGLNQFKFISSE